MRALAAIPLATLILAGCTTTGAGTGSSPGGKVHATFAWKAEGPTRGTMTATLDTGETYAGPFFQITHETTTEELGPLWTGWEGRWGMGGWGAWGPSEGFSTTYSGKVLANLQGPAGHMRCRFTLMVPSSGMSGGGTGRCQLPNGTMIQADFNPG
jgi:hypothetical protein